MALFSLIAKLGLDKTGFDAGLSAAQSSAMKFGAGLKAQLAAAFSVAALTTYTRSLIEYASRVKDASLRTGASTDALQSLGHAAKMTGSDFETVVRSFKDLSKARQEALDDPKSKALQVFRALGIDGEKLKSLKLEDLFREIGRAFESQDFGASELAMVTELLGRAGAELLPAFKQGMDELEQQAVEAGVVLGEELLGPLDELGDQFDTLTAQLRGPFAEALVFVLKQANQLLTTLKAGFEAVTNFAQGFKAGFKDAKPNELGWVGKLFPVLDLFARAGQRVQAGVKGGQEQVAQAQAEGEAGGAVEDEGGPQFVMAKDIKERNRRQFNFEKAIKELSPKTARQAQGDALGRIGGTVGSGGDAVQNKLTEMVRELKELRRHIEVRGVRINGQL